MSIVEDMRGNRQAQKNTEKQQDETIRGWEDRLNGVAKRLVARENAAGNKIDIEDAKSMIRDFVKESAVAEGKYSRSQIDDGEYDDLDMQEYGSGLLDEAFSNVGSRDSAAKEYIKESITNPSFQKGLRGIFGSNIRNMFSPTPLGEAINNGFLFGATEGLIKDVKSFNKNIDEYYEKKNKDAFDEGFDLIKNYRKYMTSPDAKKASADITEKSDNGTGENAGSSNGKKKKASKKSSDDETTDEEVTFTLTANDPKYRGFGQKLVDLGLATDNGLWGENGDVKFYEKQLADQGAIDIVGDHYGNLKTGIPIKLRKRKNRKS
jgi:hypothetical protein